MKQVAIIGAGPAGLMAAEIIAAAGHNVAIYDHMPSAGRKFLMAGRGGLNLTHSEPLEAFLTRYGAASEWLAPSIHAFPPEKLRAWAEEHGQPTFVGSSGRVFPEGLKASPLLRACLQKLESLGVKFYPRHRWTGWGWGKNGGLTFTTANGGTKVVKADATLLALGGASWPRLGSDGGWVDILKSAGVAVTPLSAANSGFTVAWTKIFSDKFQGQPLKPVTLRFGSMAVQGEAMVTATGLEGGAIYALSSYLRQAIDTHGKAILRIDLRPGVMEDDLKDRLSSPRRSQTLTNFLRKFGGLSAVGMGLLYEAMPAKELAAKKPSELAALIKACPVELTATSGIGRAISTAGGIAQEALDEHFMLLSKPGVFAAGEMLDWEAPTGGYLLQACFSTGVAAAHGILAWLDQPKAS